MINTKFSWRLCSKSWSSQMAVSHLVRVYLRAFNAFYVLLISPFPWAGKDWFVPNLSLVIWKFVGQICPMTFMKVYVSLEQSNTKWNLWDENLIREIRKLNRIDYSLLMLLSFHVANRIWLDEKKKLKGKKVENKKIIE